MGDNEGFSIYHDGRFVAKSSVLTGVTHLDGPGVVIIGKSGTETEEDFASVTVDELTFWDRQLLPEELKAIANLG